MLTHAYPWCRAGQLEPQAPPEPLALLEPLELLALQVCYFRI